MTALRSVLLAALVAAAAASGCPNKCSGHGSCVLGDRCACQPRFTGNDCSERECSYGLSWVTSTDSDRAPAGTMSTCVRSATTIANYGSEACSQYASAECTASRGCMKDGTACKDRCAASSKGSACGTGDRAACEWAQGEGLGGRHGYAECSDKGKCDRSTGECQCYEGYEGKGCRRQKCPNSCSGHGRCVYNSAANAQYAPHTSAAASAAASHSFLGPSIVGDNMAGWGTTTVGHFIEFASQYWDARKSRTCACDRGFEGTDCSQRVCPHGDDPLTDCHEGTHVVDKQTLHFSRNAYNTDGRTSGKGFYTLTFTDHYGGAYTTRPIATAAGTSLDYTCPGDRDDTEAGTQACHTDSMYARAADWPGTTTTNGVTTANSPLPSTCPAHWNKDGDNTAVTEEEDVAGLSGNNDCVGGGLTGNGQVKAQAYADDIEAALEALPNFVVPNVTVVAVASWHGGLDKDDIPKSTPGLTAEQARVVLGYAAPMAVTTAAIATTFRTSDWYDMEVSFVDPANSGTQNLLQCSSMGTTPYRAANGGLSATGDSQYSLATQSGSSFDSQFNFAAAQPRFFTPWDGESVTQLSTAECMYTATGAVRTDADPLCNWIYGCHDPTPGDASTGTACEKRPDCKGTFGANAAASEAACAAEAGCEWVLPAIPTGITDDTNPPGTCINADGVWDAYVYAEADAGAAYGDVNDVIQVAAYVGASANAEGGAKSWGGRICYATHTRAEAEVVKENSECSNRGKCDGSSGLCDCYEGFTGEACATQTVFF